MAEYLVTLTAAGTAGVEQNLSGVEHSEGMPKAGHEAGTVVPGAPEHAEASVFGVVTGPVVVSIAMLAFIAILLWKKVPGVIAGALDKQIADIRRQLDEAKALRAEAETLRDDYAGKIAAAQATTADMMAHAGSEAEAIVAQAKTDAADLVTRRARMAEDRIAAAERTALAEVRAKAAQAATAAAATLIAQRHDAAADKSLVDSTIAGLGRPN